MDDCKCFSCPLEDCVSPCPFGVDIDYDIDEYILDKDELDKQKYSYLSKREKVRLYKKAYYKKNKEHILAQQKAYRQSRKDKLKEKKEEKENTYR